MNGSVMMGPMQRAAVLSLTLVLVAVGLTGCGLFGGSSRLDDALEVVPGSADRVIFVDRAAIAERFEVDDIETGASEDGLEEWVEKSRQFPGFTALAQYVQVMQDAPFSDLDIEWEVTAFEDADGFIRAWKMRDDLDLDEVGDELVDDLGFEELDEPGDARSFTIGTRPIEPDQQYLFALSNLTIVPDEHLVIAAANTEEVLDVVNDDADSAVDSDTFEDLAESIDEVEVAALSRGKGACSLGAELSEKQLEASGITDLGHAEQNGFFVHGDEGEARSVLVFDDEESAEDDAKAREEFLESGSSPVSGVPYSEFGDWEIETDGDQVRIDIDYDEPEAIWPVISRGDYLSVCSPE
jgi:hypothetical protein